jgi:P-type Mg2+ transporter
VIVGLSVALGFVNEYRAEKAAEALHSEIHHRTVVVRDGQAATVDVTTLVPGDVLELKLGDLIPADRSRACRASPRRIGTTRCPGWPGSG